MAENLGVGEAVRMVSLLSIYCHECLVYSDGMASHTDNIGCRKSAFFGSPSQILEGNECWRNYAYFAAK